jgi:predicted GNAT family N-acyltransferase
MSSDFDVKEGARSGNPLVQGTAWSDAPAPGSPPSVTNRKAFEPGAYAPDGGFVFVTNPPSADLEQTYDMAVREIGNVAPLPVLQSVYAHNRCSWWVIHRSGDERRLDASVAGFCAFLPLNAAGLAALKDGTLEPRDPDLALLAPEGEDPAALYLWATVAHGLWDFSGKLIAHALGLDLYERLPVFGRIGTQAGLEALKRSSKVAPGSELRIGAPFEVRLTPKHIEAQRAMRIYEGRRPKEPRMHVLSSRFQTLVAATPDHLAKVFAIRAAVYMSEQNCPYDEEYDGNDFTCTHILGLVEGQPAAVLRIRYFADFVKIERLAVLPRFRGSRIAFAVVEHALNLVRRKGYRTAYGHAQKKVVAFWSRFGFKPMAKNTSLVFSDHEYVEMVASLEPHHDRITIHSDPYVILRPEGRWDEEGVLDKSAERPATNPR